MGYAVHDTPLYPASEEAGLGAIKRRASFLEGTANGDAIHKSSPRSPGGSRTGLDGTFLGSAGSNVASCGILIEPVKQRHSDQGL